MANESIFATEWRECLQAQYRHVVRNNDQVTLKTLVGVMHEVGFSDDELRELEFEATLRTEDVADDFVPNMEIMSGAQPVAKPEAALPAEVVPPEELSGDDLGMTLEETLAVADAVLEADDAETQPEADVDPVAVAGDDDHDDADDADEADDPPSTLPPGVQQLSLF